MLCRSTFSLAPPLRSTSSAAAEALFARFLATSAESDFSVVHSSSATAPGPTRSRPRLAGTALEISRFPCTRRARMPGSTTRGVGKRLAKVTPSMLPNRDGPRGIFLFQFSGESS